MIKYILLIFIFIPVLSMSQVDSNLMTFEGSTDSIRIAKSTLIKVGEKIRSQQDTIQRQQIVIDGLKEQNFLQSVMINKQNDELTLLYTRVEITDGIVDRYKDLIRKEQWYDSTWVHVGSGFLGALVVSIIVNNIK